MKHSEFLLHAAECALVGERKSEPYPRKWSTTIDYMALTWSEDEEEFESPEHECMSLCLSAMIAEIDGQ